MTVGQSRTGLFRTITEENRYYAVLSGASLAFYDRPQSSSSAAASAASASSATLSSSSRPILLLSCDGCFVKSGQDAGTLLLETQPNLGNVGNQRTLILSQSDVSLVKWQQQLMTASIWSNLAQSGQPLPSPAAATAATAATMVACVYGMACLNLKEGLCPLLHSTITSKKQRKPKEPSTKKPNAATVPESASVPVDGNTPSWADICDPDSVEKHVPKAKKSLFRQTSNSVVATTDSDVVSDSLCGGAGGPQNVVDDDPETMSSKSIGLEEWNEVKTKSKSKKPFVKRTAGSIDKPCKAGTDCEHKETCWYQHPDYTVPVNETVSTPAVKREPGSIDGLCKYGSRCNNKDKCWFKDHEDKTPHAPRKVSSDVKPEPGSIDGTCKWGSKCNHQDTCWYKCHDDVVKTDYEPGSINKRCRYGLRCENIETCRFAIHENPEPGSLAGTCRYGSRCKNIDTCYWACHDDNAKPGSVAGTCPEGEACGAFLKETCKWKHH